MAPVNLPSGTIRLHQLRRCLTPILRNRAASLYALDGDVRLVEFHSKANALTDDSMAVVAAAASDHGRGIIIHNDAQHFSAGVDLAAVLALIRAKIGTVLMDFYSVFRMRCKPCGMRRCR